MRLRIFCLIVCAVFATIAGSALAQPASVVYPPWMKGEETRANRFADPSEIQGHEDAGSASNTRIAARTAQSGAPGATKPSALESMYAQRITGEPVQFGYDLFGVPAPETQNMLDNLSETPSGAVQDDFILHEGDELEVLFTGQRTDRGLYKINTQGLVLIEDFPPIPAAGRSIGQLRISIEAAAKHLYNTEAYVSLSSVRQIGVLVVGHVKRPGRQNLTVFHTALDALMKAGGVQKTGSLRQIKLVRGGRSTIIDLYALLLHGGSSPDLRLRDGDRIIVPSIGPTVAVTGEVKRPGIFEILPVVQGMRHAPDARSEKLTLNDMLELSGGVMAPGENRFIRLDVDTLGREQVSEINISSKPLFGDGSILAVARGTEKRTGTVELQGHTRRPGLHALTENPALSALLPNAESFGPDIYPLIGVIKRQDPEQLTQILLPFPLRLVLSGDFDRKLEDGDVVYLFSTTQIRHLAEESLPVAETQDNDVGSREGTDRGPDFIDDPDIASFLTERSSFVRGAVRRPGAYPVADGTALDALLSVAGGLTLEASTHGIEITSALQGEGHQKNARSGTRRMTLDLRESSPKDITIGPGDSVRVGRKFHKVEDKSVLIMGEVRNPGRYGLMPGDKMSDLLERAGGLTEQAYPYGTIFSREAERRAEESRFRAQARDMERSIAAALESDEKKLDAGKIAQARALASELREAEAVGRITVEADPGVLAAKPELDILLETGDRVFIPKRSLNVRVHGEVLSPASLQFREGKTPLEYIEQAGGFTFHADKDRTFVLFPDGSAQPLQVSPWNHRASFIPPGATIIIPRDPKPFDFIESAKDVSQILSNLAITAIFIDDVRDD